MPATVTSGARIKPGDRSRGPLRAVRCAGTNAGGDRPLLDAGAVASGAVGDLPVEPRLRIDAAVSAEVLALIAPLGLDAALQANADRERAGMERLRQIELALEQARYEAARAHRQYDAVDPDNRLLSATSNDGGMNGSRKSRALKTSFAQRAISGRRP